MICCFIPAWQRKLACGPPNLHSMSKSVYSFEPPNKLNFGIKYNGHGFHTMDVNYDFAIGAGLLYVYVVFCFCC